MKRIPSVTLVSLFAGGLSLLAGHAARADIPAGYTGKPFDPKVAGGPKCPATVQAGPYAIPGRLDFVNYDLGGEGITYHTGDHLIKPGNGYRTDAPTASLSVTTSCIPTGNTPCQNVWYDTSPTLDGTVYPSPTTADFSIAAVQNGDWFDITVNVATAGTYSLSSTFATGNGPPGGEGGDGTMGLAVYSNGTMLATWSAIFPNFNTTADFHHWKAYPNFATVTLSAGLQVIKLEAKAKHLQPDYVQFDLVGADGGTTTTDAGAPADGSLAGAGGSTGGTGGAAGVAGGAGTSGGAAGSTTGAAGSSSGPGGAGSSGSAGAGTTGAGGTTGGSLTGAAGTGTTGGKSGGCSVARAANGSSGVAGSLLAVAVMSLGLFRRTRRRRR
jgi:hypothetical protein